MGYEGIFGISKKLASYIFIIFNNHYHFYFSLRKFDYNLHVRLIAL